MAPSRLVITFALTALAAAPAFAQDAQRRRAGSDRRDRPAAEGGQTERAQPRERAVPRVDQSRRAEQARRDEQVRRQAQARRDEQFRRDQQARRDDNRYDNRRDNDRRYGNGRFAYRPRVIRPTIVRVIPYRPYVYRPSYRIGVYYGAGGSYPYGYTPRGYYDPIPGRLYGGVRITGAPRDAHVFADGYYVGIVNDFDGIFQHMNLEAGPHHIEIDLGYDAIEFDVYVRPGQTTTFRY